MRKKLKLFVYFYQFYYFEGCLDECHVPSALDQAAECPRVTVVVLCGRSELEFKKFQFDRKMK